ncbi:hypothetical protein PG993_008208 [Apiospora rasikravindrae]|uniref:MYND-type domain-containing protein n=1 Tax=Apiospora rasikravindrae TaxID=990691 RepID=A0ABR1SZP7_9PEZI
MEPTKECGNPHCKHEDSSDTKDLMRCSQCHGILYCSKECQKRHWPSHKIYCQHLATNGSSSESFCALHYYITIAGQDPPAQALMKQLGLPARGGIPAHKRKYRFRLPLRRLVVTGQDTPENLTLFFGKGKEAEDVIDCQHSYRLEVLFGSTPGSMRHEIIMQCELDLLCPHWSPRPASATEDWEVQEIRAFHHEFRNNKRLFYPGGTLDNRVQFLVERYGAARWEEMNELYMYALEFMT